ncbi:hypothetical protein [Acanthopleuribacter pedis]|uniref:Uncharacterized protein n=1 Tax=Acanthopleuribacter pedis TaxID=442870 RepID=A0A8J7QN34_9BACT|nr:hypothetical protein [Acanthopleuribacter pedis]MBO1321443.1 hypothetical protein [Acanthopleuribacter pedis]
MKYLNHNALIMCCHGGIWTPRQPPPPGNCIAGGAALITEQELLDGTLACPLAIKPCTAIQQLVTGQVRGFLIKGESPVLATFTAITDGGTASAIQDGNSGAMVLPAFQTPQLPAAGPCPTEPAKQGEKTATDPANNEADGAAPDPQAPRHRLSLQLSLDLPRSLPMPPPPVRRRVAFVLGQGKTRIPFVLYLPDDGSPQTAVFHLPAPDPAWLIQVPDWHGDPGGQFRFEGEHEPLLVVPDDQQLPFPAHPAMRQKGWQPTWSQLLAPIQQPLPPYPELARLNQLDPKDTALPAWAHVSLPRAIAAGQTEASFVLRPAFPILHALTEARHRLQLRLGELDRTWLHEATVARFHIARLCNSLSPETDGVLARRGGTTLAKQFLGELKQRALQVVPQLEWDLQTLFAILTASDHEKNPAATVGAFRSPRQGTCPARSYEGIRQQLARYFLHVPMFLPFFEVDPEKTVPAPWLKNTLANPGILSINQTLDTLVQALDTLRLLHLFAGTSLKDGHDWEEELLQLAASWYREPDQKALQQDPTTGYAQLNTQRLVAGVLRSSLENAARFDAYAPLLRRELDRAVVLLSAREKNAAHILKTFRRLYGALLRHHPRSAKQALDAVIPVATDQRAAIAPNSRRRLQWMLLPVVLLLTADQLAEENPHTEDWEKVLIGMADLNDLALLLADMRLDSMKRNLKTLARERTIHQRFQSFGALHRHAVSWSHLVNIIRRVTFAFDVVEMGLHLTKDQHRLAMLSMLIMVAGLATPLTIWAWPALLGLSLLKEGLSPGAVEQAVAKILAQSAFGRAQQVYPTRESAADLLKNRDAKTPTALLEQANHQFALAAWQYAPARFRDLARPSQAHADQLLVQFSANPGLTTNNLRLHHQVAELPSPLTVETTLLDTPQSGGGDRFRLMVKVKDERPGADITVVHARLPGPNYNQLRHDAGPAFALRFTEGRPQSYTLGPLELAADAQLTLILHPFQAKLDLPGRGRRPAPTQTEVTAETIRAAGSTHHGEQARVTEIREITIRRNELRLH